jgi:hypothetical protein
MNGSYKMEQVEATCRSSHDDVMVFVDDSIWGDQITSEDIVDLESKLHHTTPTDSTNPSAGIVSIERDLFEKDRTPITLLLTDSEAQFEGYFSPMDLLPDEEAQKYGGRSNETPMVHLNAVRAKDHLAPVFSHEVQHLFHFQHDQDEETWLRELLAQAAMNLTGHRDVEMEQQSRAHPTAPIITGDEEVANYPGLTSFAAHLQKRFGTDVLTRLNQHQANGVESINKTLQEMGREETFESVLKDHFVECAIDVRAKKRIPLERYRVGDQGGLLPARTKPGGAEFIHLANAEPLSLTVQDWQQGMFLERVTFGKGGVERSTLVPENGKILLDSVPDQFLMLGSAGPDSVARMAFSPG